MTDTSGNGVLQMGVRDETRSALVALAQGRRLIVDWSVSNCCGAAIGDLRLTWHAANEPPDPHLVPISGVGPVEGWCRPELVDVLDGAGARLEVRGIGPFRRATIVLERPELWLDFVAEAPARS